MTVTNTSRVTMRKLGVETYQDAARHLAMPSGLWTGVSQVTGDASAGLAFVGLTANVLETWPKAWSVEEVQLLSDPPAGVTPWHVLWVTGDDGFTIGTSDGVVHKAEGRQLAIAGASVWTTFSLMQPRTRSLDQDPLTKRIFIPRPGKNDTMTVQGIALNTNLQNYNMRAWGYCWERGEYDAGKTLVRP